MLFLYFNDRWYPLVGVQLNFAVADNACLLLRWADAMPGARAGLWLLHM